MWQIFVLAQRLAYIKKEQGQPFLTCLQREIYSLSLQMRKSTVPVFRKQHGNSQKNLWSELPFDPVTLFLE